MTGATTNSTPGYDHVEVFSTIDTEYLALREGAGLLDRSARVRVRFGGKQAADTLNGLLTNDISLLKPGNGCYAVALTNKGKVIADVRVFAREGDFLLDAPEEAGPGLLAMLRKYVNPRLAQFEDQTASLRCVGVFGDRAHAVLANVLGLADTTLRTLAPYMHVRAEFAGGEVDVARVPDLGVEGFDIFVRVETAAALWARLETAGATPAGAAAAELLRVEAGRPRYGVDMDENTLAQEANMEALDAISFNKGCYTGQETVARVHFRGHVNKSLRGLSSDASLERGDKLTGPDGEPCGEVRSAVQSPRFGMIAIAMIRSEVEDGATVRVAGPAGAREARVRPVPFV